MADIRTLKLALLADTKDFISGLDKADKETRSFTNKLDDALKVGAAAFLAVGAAAATMAIKIGVDAVKAAIDSGYHAGAGYPLLLCSKKLNHVRIPNNNCQEVGYHCLLKAITAPAKTILFNAGLDKYAADRVLEYQKKEQMNNLIY